MDLDLPPPQAAPGAGNPVGREPGSGFSPDTEPAGTVIWNFQPLELRDMKACLCPPPGSGSLWQQPGWPEHGSRRLSGQYKPLLFFKSSGGCKQHHLGSGLVLSPLHCVPLRRARASLGLRVFIYTVGMAVPKSPGFKGEKCKALRLGRWRGWGGGGEPRA